MVSPVRVLHYVNQFFGGFGGEEHANMPVQVKEGAVGPGRALQGALGKDGSVIATIIAGDNHVVEEKATAMRAVREALQRFKPDVVVAGPAFEAGRYGLACAEVCLEAQSQGIPAVTGMYPDNPGVLAHRQQLICVPTGTSSAEMVEVAKKMSALALKLARKQEVGPAEDGYLPRGIRKLVVHKETGAQRAVDMLKAALEDKTVVTEVWVREFDFVPPAAPIESLKDAVIALVTTGGLVPRGNPDKMPPLFSTRHYRYSVEGLNELSLEAWESVHAGFNTNFINTHDPNYALPLPAMRLLEARGVFKKLHPWFFSAAGVATAVRDSRNIGAAMANELQAEGVNAALLVAT